MQAHARQRIERQLEQCGWAVQDYAALNLSAQPGVAVRDVPLRTGVVDYLLCAGGDLIAMVVIKKRGVARGGVEVLSSRFGRGLPADIPCQRGSAPFAYEVFGSSIRFISTLDSAPANRPVFAFHQVEELLGLLAQKVQLRDRLRRLPVGAGKCLRPAQRSAVDSLEKALATGHQRVLAQMACGSGKTLTAVTLIDRLLKFAGAKRVLYLVDNQLLGRQVLTAFQQYVSPYDGQPFAERHYVQQPRHRAIDPRSEVCITTMQRLYAILSDSETLAVDELSLYETAISLFRAPMPVSYAAQTPIETFDFIVIDECHCSVFDFWRQVLEYFDAFLIGLSAIPSARAVAFFGGNLVYEYSHEHAVADGIAVDFEVYRAADEHTGVASAPAPCLLVPRRDRRTRQEKRVALDDDRTPTAEQRGLDVVADNRIRAVVRSFREHLFSVLFPGREDVPKTLIFARSDLHADDIVAVVRAEFTAGEDFCRKITGDSGGVECEERLREFATLYEPRIVVTTDTMATGIDIPALECLIFMRNVYSKSYLELMKGRGCRAVDVEALQQVSPDARCKTHCVVIDAVGIVDQDRTLVRPLNLKPSLTLEEVLAAARSGGADAELICTLAVRLARLDKQIGGAQRTRIEQQADGCSLAALIAELLISIDPDAVRERAIGTFRPLMEKIPTGHQLALTEAKMIKEALQPFLSPALCGTILAIHSALQREIDESTWDVLLRAGVDIEAEQKARALLARFQHFIEQNRDDIEALRVLYKRPYRSGLNYEQVKVLAAAIKQPPLSASPERLWNAFLEIAPKQVEGYGGKQLVDLIALVRHSLDPDEPLVSVKTTIEERYQDWLADQAVEGVVFTPEQQMWLNAIKDYIARHLSVDEYDFEQEPFHGFGGLARVFELFGQGLAPLLEELNERLSA